MKFLLPVIGSLVAALAGLVVVFTGSSAVRPLGWVLLGCGVFFLTINLAMRKMMR